jgi:hypothetical protein
MVPTYLNPKTRGTTYLALGCTPTSMPGPTHVSPAPDAQPRKGVRWALASARLPPRGQGGQSTRVRKLWALAILFATGFLGRASILPPSTQGRALVAPPPPPRPPAAEPPPSFAKAPHSCASAHAKAGSCRCTLNSTT